MTNPPRAKGTAGESAVVKWARDHGFPGADRQPQRGNLDQGDVALCPGIVIEVKVSKTAGRGQPGEALLAGWLAECETERVNAGAAHCPLVVKRSGTRDVGRWWAYLPTVDFLEIVSGTEHITRPSMDPICVSVASLVALLRAGGYGDPPDSYAEAAL